ncbi:serpin family protein [Brevibacterium salitolerans]|uniref:Serpin domain-containing protein n=1 Tax=Brevibacterium salitolerans TaxID=1403566 RepID=A0ABN2WMR8_9MICO
MRGDVQYEPVSVSAASAVGSAVAATTQLGVHFAAEAGEGNVVVSPASIAVALALLAEGADGQTQAAFDEVLGAAGPERTAAFSALQDAVLAYDGDPCLVQAEELPERPLLHLANGITADEARPLEQEYLHALARAYGAGVRTADFAGGKGKPVLDAWVDAHTGGLIEESAIDPDADTAFVLQNAVLMAARWRSPFAEAGTCERPFTTASDAVRAPATMHQTLTAGYVEDGGMQAVRLPYTEAFAMDVVLPAEDASPGDLSAEEWTRISEALGSGNADTEVALALPKLSFRSSTALDEAFRTIGLGPMYSPRQPGRHHARGLRLAVRAPGCAAGGRGGHRRRGRHGDHGRPVRSSAAAGRDDGEPAVRPADRGRGDRLAAVPRGRQRPGGVRACGEHLREAGDDR